MTDRFSCEKVAYYTKTIEISDTGIVFAQVYAHAADGHQLRRVGFNHYSAFWMDIGQRAERAHKWADNYMAICQQYEVQEAKK